MYAVALPSNVPNPISVEEQNANVAAAIAANPAAAQFLPEFNQTDPVAFNTVAITPEIAKDLMWRSMTTGVPSSEYNQYGGYEAVANAYKAAGGGYDRAEIPQDLLQKYAQTVADTGVGNLEILKDTSTPLSNQAIENMKLGGGDPAYIQSWVDQYQKQIYDQWVANQYANVGQQGIGSLASNINPESAAYLSAQIASGAISKEDLPEAFEKYIREYKKANPNDPYANYITEYQLGQQKDVLKTNLSGILEDSQISLDEAKQIRAYQDNYNFTPDQIANATGYSIDQVRQVLGSPEKILSNVISSNANNPAAIAKFANENGFTSQQLADASGGKFTADQAQAVMDKASTYAGLIELASPEAWSQIKNLATLTADQHFGGEIQDYQVQLFTPLDTQKVGAPTQLEFAIPPVEISQDEYGNPVNIIRPGHLTTQGITPEYNFTEDSGAILTGYKSITPTVVNGVPVYAQYDAKGKLTGYQGDPGTITWLTSNQKVSGAWDAQGNANPVSTVVRSSGGGGLFGGFLGEVFNDFGGAISDLTQDLGPIWTIAKIVNPELNLVDFGANVAQGNLNTNTAISGLLGAAGVQNANAANVANTTSGIDIGSGVSPAVQLTQDANNLKLAAAATAAVKAADTGNYAPLLNVAANVSGAYQMPGVSTALNTVTVVNAVNNNDMTSLLGAAGNLTGSQDLKLASAANRFIEAYNSGNQNAIVYAASALGDAASKNSETSGAVQTLKDFVSGVKTDIVDTLKGAGLTETAGAQQPKYVDVQDVSAGSQVVGPGGLPEGAFKPNGITQTATGLFFTTAEGNSFPISVNKQTGEVTALDPAYADSVKQLRINDTSAIKPVFFDKTPLDVPMTFDELTELAKVTGKAEGPTPDITDVQAKDIVNAAKGGASITDLLKMVGGTDVIESAIGIDALMNIPGIKDAMNVGYVNELADHLATDPNNQVWLEEYKKITGMDYVLPSMGEIVITGQKEKGDDRVVALDQDGNEVTIADILRDMESLKTTAPTTTKPVTPTVTAPSGPVEPPAIQAPVQQPPAVPPAPPVPPTTTVTPPGEPPSAPVVTEPPATTPPADTTTPTTTTPATKTPTTTTAQSTGLNFPQVQQALAAAGIPQLANVFYYGKEFGSQKQKLTKQGKLATEEYDPLSVTKAGAVGELEEQVAEEAKTKENDINTALDHILGASSNSTSLDDLLNIVKGA